MDEIIDLNTLFGPLPSASSDLPVDALLALMQKHAVRAACTLSTLGVLLDPAVGNAATRAACADHPELLPTATLNPTAFFGDPAQVNALKSDGFRLVRFFPAMQGWPVEYAPFRALLASLRGTNLPVMVQVEQRGDVTRLEALVGDYPAPVVLAGAGIELLAEAVAGLRTHAHWHVSLSNLLSVGAVKAVADAVGPERLLFGTSAPAHPVAAALNAVRLAGLSPEGRALVLGGNARRVLSL